MKNLVAYFAFGSLLASAVVACGESGQSPGGGTSGSGSGQGGTVSPAAGVSSGASAGMVGTSGSSPMGGVGTGGTSGGANGGSAGSGGAKYEGLYPNGSCSEKTLRTGPPAELALFKQDPIDTKFPFSSHWIGPWPANTEPKLMGQTVMADLDDDGDLDFAAGQRNPPLSGGMWWWERCTDDHWVAHKVGEGHSSDSSGDALDVDKDGLIDIVAGDSWFKNPGKSRDMEWPRFSAGNGGFNAEDLVVGDVTGDDMAEILYVNNGDTPAWYKVGATPEQGFQLGGKLGNGIQQGTAWGDLNGDGMNDWLMSAQWWYENVNKGASFTARQVTAATGFDANSPANAPLTFVGDVDGDGDNDFAAGSHWLGGNQNAQLAWFENTDGKGLSFTKHQLSTTGLYSHGVILADFDNDDDLDLLWARNVGPTFIWDNTDGKGAFVEHKIVNEFRGHTPRIGDVDCDGDLDIAGGPWGDQGPADHGETSKPPRDYVYLKNHAVENGAKPIFDADRKPYELGWREKYHCR